MSRTIVSFLLWAFLSAEASVGDSFVWSSAEINGKVYKKASILVPLKFPGFDKKVYAQLDTGSDATIFYGKLMRRHGLPIDSVTGTIPPFRWYGHGTDPLEKTAIIDWSMDSETDMKTDKPEDNIVGTVGLDKVVGKILVLDFPTNQYAILADTLDLAGHVPASIGYCDAAISYNKFYVNVLLGPDTIYGVRYDCGSSTSTLILPLDWWRWATGLTGQETQVIKDSAYSWGKLIETWLAPAKYELKFGRISVSAPMVTYVDWPDPTMVNAKFLGNAPFYDDYVVVVDCIRGKFGVGQWQDKPLP